MSITAEKMKRNEVVWQIFMNGPTWDGDLISKSDRDEAFAKGFIFRHEGWQSLTEAGLRVCLAAEYDREKEKRRRS